MINVLLVDDMQLHRQSLHYCLLELNQYEFSIEEAENGKVALRKLKNKRFDILILDWEMPKMSGLDVLNEISTSKNHENVSIIINSGYEKDYIKLLINKSLLDNKRIPDECILSSLSSKKLQLAIEKII